MNASEVLEAIVRDKIEFVDLKFSDLPGSWHHVTLPARELEASSFTAGLPFDGSSLRGFREIEESDMILMPDPNTAFVDPFYAHATLSLVADVLDPALRPYGRDPRGVAKRAEAYLLASGIADRAYFGPELEFFVFDDVRFDNSPNSSFFSIDGEESAWSSGDAGSRPGYRIRAKEGYAPVPPLDALSDLRSEMVLHLEAVGIRVERHHHEVATAGQGEIGFTYDTLVKTADNVLTFKYVVKNTAVENARSATFMPKPLFGDNGSGMHTHQSLWKGKTPLFFDQQGYGQMSETALFYIGGILRHAPALVGLCNASTNSFRRLVPGYEAPTDLVFSKGNRSAAVRIPISAVTPKSSRIEFRTPDSTGNPYLALSAMLMAGLDGIKNRIDPRKLGMGPLDKNIYHLSERDRKKIRSVPSSLTEALGELKRDHAFLLEGGVFSRDLVEAWIDYKMSHEVHPVGLRPTPYEFQLYYDI